MHAMLYQLHIQQIQLQDFRCVFKLFCKSIKNFEINAINKSKLISWTLTLKSLFELIKSNPKLKRYFIETCQFIGI